MPYIQISLSKKLTDEEKRALAAGVAALVPMLPGKPGDSLYRGGEPAACAFMETRLYGKTPEPYLRAYTEKLFELFEEQLGYGGNQIYFNILELDHWGSKGSLR